MLLCYHIQPFHKTFNRIVTEKEQTATGSMDENMVSCQIRQLSYLAGRKQEAGGQTDAKFKNHIDRGQTDGQAACRALCRFFETTRGITELRRV